MTTLSDKRCLLRLVLYARHEAVRLDCNSTAVFLDEAALTLWTAMRSEINGEKPDELDNEMMQLILTRRQDQGRNSS